jgi:hypothetical protein
MPSKGFTALLYEFIAPFVAGFFISVKILPIVKKSSYSGVKKNS